MNVTANTMRHVHFMAAKRWTLLPQSPCQPGVCAGGGRGVCSGEWCMATATSHEATKSNCVATDCALGGPRGGSSATRAAGCTGQEEECEWEGGGFVRGTG